MPYRHPLRERGTVSVCAVEDCGRQVKARGYCEPHVVRLRKTGDVRADVPIALRSSRGPCLVPDCERIRSSREGYCGMHAMRLKRYGELGHPGPTPRVDLPGYKSTVLTRLMGKISRSVSGCWEWQGAITPDGYGRQSYRGRARRAHRVAYELIVGEIPAGLVLDHLCRNRSCVNPAHLEPVTDRINLLRGIGPTADRASRTHCPQGHAYDLENTYVDRRGSRHCRACGRARARKQPLPKETK